MKKVTLVAIALVLALGALGVGYAMWSDTVTVTANVQTGTVDIAITDQAMLDGIASPPYYLDGPEALWDYTSRDGFAGPAPLFWHTNKNVSWGECDFDGNTMWVTLYNTYPSNFNSATVYVSNLGTIPVILWKTDVYRWDDVLADWVFVVAWTAGFPTISVDMDGDGDLDLDIHYGDNFGTQLEPGGDPAEISYWIHTRQTAEQGATYKFKFVLTAVQYNEYPPPGP